MENIITIVASFGIFGTLAAMACMLNWFVSTTSNGRYYWNKYIAPWLVSNKILSAKDAYIKR